MSRFPSPSTTESITPDMSEAFLAEDIGWRLLTVATILLVADPIFVGLRFFARRLSKREFGWDDGLMIPALLFNMMLCILSIISVPMGGVGRHTQVISTLYPEKWIVFVKLSFLAGPIIYLFATNIPKMAILNMYLRIFQDRASRLACYATMAFLVLILCATVPVPLGGCIPLNFMWHKEIEGGHCIQFIAFLRWVSLPNIITDVILLVLPLPTIWKLQTTHRAKIGLTLTFLTGSIGLIVSVIRFAFFAEAGHIIDRTYDGVKLFILIVCESSIYLICACLLTYRPLAKWAASKSAFASILSHFTPSKSRKTKEEDESRLTKQESWELARRDDLEKAQRAGGSERTIYRDPHTGNLGAIRVDREFGIVDSYHEAQR